MSKKLLIVMFIMFALSGSSLMASELLKLIPDEADFVFQINIKKIVENPSIKKNLTDGLNNNPEQKKAFASFVKATGFDPLKNLNSVYVFTSGKTEPNVALQNAGAILSGVFNPAKMLEGIKNDKNAAKDVQITKIDGFDAVVPKNKKDGYGLFLDTKTVVVGTEAGVNSVKNIKLGKAKNVSSRKDFAAVLSKLDTNAFLSGAGLFPAELKAKIKANPQAAPLASINYFFFGLNLGETVDFNFNGEIDKKENTQSVMTSLNGFLALLKMVAGQAPEASEILNMIKLEAKDTTVRISLMISKTKLDEIKAMMEKKIKDFQKKLVTPKSKKDTKRE